MLFVRSLGSLAPVAVACVLLLCSQNAASTQELMYRPVMCRTPTVTGVQPASHDYPCDCRFSPCELPAPQARATAASEDENDSPEMADLTRGAVFVSASHGDVPNAIGDALGIGGCFVLSDGANVISACLAGGRRYKATNNNSPIPRARVYYNYHHFQNALAAQVGANPAAELNAQRHELGVEYPFWCNLASIQVDVPLSNAIHNDLDLSTAAPVLRDTELGNVAVALKGVLYQDCSKTISVGVGVDLPTADHFSMTDGVNTLVFENESITISPFVGAVLADPCSNYFMQGFVQLSMPLNENTFSIGDGGVTPPVDVQVQDATLLHIDGSVGYWLRRDCCGNGLAAIVEVHYTANFDGAEVFTDANYPGASLTRVDGDFVYATAGATWANGCWLVTPAIVLPLLDEPDRLFDWAALMQVNRRF